MKYLLLLLFTFSAFANGLTFSEELAEIEAEYDVKIPIDLVCETECEPVMIIEESDDV